MKTIKELAVKHDYYCSDSNYYSNDARQEFDDFDDFFAEMGDADVDMNLMFRWDVKENYDDDDKPTGEYYLEAFFIQQRKGKFVPIHIRKIEEKDVQKFTEFAAKHWAKLKSIWEPLS